MKKNILLICLSILISPFLFAGQGHQNDQNNVSLNNEQVQFSKYQDLSLKAPFDIEFQWSVADTVNAASLTGVAWTGTEFWISRWNQDTLWQLNPDGTFNSKFTIPGISSTRSLTWDGTNIYSGSASDFIYEIDPVTQTNTATINLPAASVGARMCAYDPTADGGNGGFWIGNFTSNIQLYSRAGALLTDIPAASHGIEGMYGGAVDTATAGGPYLLVYAQDAPGSGANKIYWMHIPTETNTGIVYNINNDLAPADSGIAGGLFVANDIIAGESHILSLTQGAKGILTAYELGFSPQLTSFDLVTPSSGTTLQIDNSQLGTTIAIDWESSSELNGSAVTYEWLLDTAGGDFSTPLATIPSDNGGADTILTLTTGAIDTLLQSLGLGAGDAVSTIWTVSASSAAVSLTSFADNGPFDLELIRDAGVRLKDFSALGLNIYPNPSQGQITIADANDIVQSVSVVDLMGKEVVRQSNFGTKLNLDLTQVSNGVYLLRLNTDEGDFVQKIILE